MNAPDQSTLETIRFSIGYLWPELILWAGIVILILTSLFSVPKSITHYITVIVVVLFLFEVTVMASMPGKFGNVSLFSDMLSSDSSSSIIKMLMGLATLLTLVMTRKDQLMEYYLLLIAILLGACFLLMSRHFIMLLLSIELISLSSYVLTAGRTNDKRRAEAAWKFFVFGSVSTAIMIFGMTYLFGEMGNGYFETGRAYQPADDTNMTLFNIGGVMTIAGFLFKMTAAPFHLWAPDVYESNPAPVAAFLSVVPKLAGMIALLILVGTLWSHGSTRENWSMIIAAFALVSVIVGTLGALAQTDAKRMMAYSSVAQAGFFLAAFSTFSQEGMIALFFYMVVFLVMNYTTFIVINLREQSGGSTEIRKFAGLGYSNPLAAVAITVGLISLTGLPPLGGFIAKLLVFSAVWARYQLTGGTIHISLFIIGLLATVASLFFYLKIPFYMFFRRSEENQPIKISPLTNLLLLILVGLLLALFFAPGVFDGLL